MRVPRMAALVFAGLALTITTACSSSDTGASPATQATQATTSAQAPATTTTTTAPASTGDQFGAACAAVPKTGPGSFSGMAQDPVATAASNNPVLSTLVTAVKQAGLVDTLNGLKDVTVFAPTNDAFAKIPKDTLDKVLADKDTLTKILTYHVVPKRITPTDLSSGSFETVEKGMLATKGSGEDYTVGASAKVVCGNVQTANATVYIIDSVLMPPA